MKPKSHSLQSTAFFPEPDAGRVFRVPASKQRLPWHGLLFDLLLWTALILALAARLNHTGLTSWASALCGVAGEDAGWLVITALLYALAIRLTRLEAQRKPAPHIWPRRLLVGVAIAATIVELGGFLVHS